MEVRCRVEFWNFGFFKKKTEILYWDIRGVPREGLKTPFIPSLKDTRHILSQGGPEGL